MATSKAQIKATRKYQDANTRQIKFNLSLKYDQDVISRLDSVPNKQGYIKELIRADIARAGSEEKKGEETMKKSELITKYADQIGEAMVRCYRAVLESDGEIQYKIYLWEDGEVQTLEGFQGDTAYLKASDTEPREIYEICTISERCFDPWDFTDHSAPDDETERENERREIIDYLVDEYQKNLPDVIDTIIEEEEQAEAGW